MPLKKPKLWQRVGLVGGLFGFFFYLVIWPLGIPSTLDQYISGLYFLAIYYGLLTLAIYAMIYKEGLGLPLQMSAIRRTEYNQCPRCGGTRIIRGKLTPKGDVLFEYEGRRTTVSTSASLCLDCGNVTASIDIERLMN